tara:strand:+ start:428 stop:553 length:126 start_codon:yes stop_codon:yes gene_type:complete
VLSSDEWFLFIEEDREIVSLPPVDQEFIKLITKIMDYAGEI